MRKAPRLIEQALARAGLEGVRRVATGVDVIGGIAIVRLPGIPLRSKRAFAAAMMEETPNLTGVFEQAGGVEGEFRLRELRHLAGRKETLTTHKENGCVFKVDVARCYFSPRLATERLRVASEVRRGERVANMFAGVGPFTVEIAKTSGAEVMSCELNAYACDLHVQNDRLNKVDDRVEVVNGDASELPGSGRGRFDRVLMPHPSAADEFLDAALGLVKKGGVIHYYRHLLARDEEEGAAAAREELRGRLPRGARTKVRKVRDVGPRWLEMTAEVRLPR